jgi:hypothetical protein
MTMAKTPSSLTSLIGHTGIEERQHGPKQIETEKLPLLNPARRFLVSTEKSAN